MRLLLPTGEVTAGTVRKAAVDHDAEVAVTGEIASFLTPEQLISLVRGGKYDMVLVSGMCTASFEEVEKETGVPVYRGPRHAADLSLVLPLLGELELSRTVPADEFFARRKAEEAYRDLVIKEKEASSDLIIRGVKIGGSSRMKVLAEIMDAHRREDLHAEVKRYFANGADIVDLGFGFDATPGDVARCFAISRISRVPSPWTPRIPPSSGQPSAGQTSSSPSMRRTSPSWARRSQKRGQPRL